jgi:hypothetical protein
MNCAQACIWLRMGASDAHASGLDDFAALAVAPEMAMELSQSPPSG